MKVVVDSSLWRRYAQTRTQAVFLALSVLVVIVMLPMVFEVRRLASLISFKNIEY